MAQDALASADRAVTAMGQLSQANDARSKVAAGDGSNPAQADVGLEMLHDLDLDVRIELGRTRMLVEDVLRLGPHAVVELDRQLGEPVDVYVNDRHVARGEVLVVDDHFCVRVTEILPVPDETLPSSDC
jgi:flagellar motor switch protein FliN/FliY